MEEAVLRAEKDMDDRQRERYRQQPDREEEHMKLTFMQVGEDTYKIYNSRTGRFHDIELGIDWVT